MIGAALATAGDPELLWRDGRFLAPVSVSGSTRPGSGS